MKRAFVAAFVLCVVLASIGTASAVTPVRAKIPFPFHAGEAMLPAGEYVFTVGAFLAVRTIDGSDSYFVPISSYDTNGRAGDYSVLFSKYEDSYFLSKVRVDGSEATSIKTRSEKRMAQNGSKPTTVAAMGSK